MCVAIGRDSSRYTKAVCYNAIIMTNEDLLRYRVIYAADKEAEVNPVTREKALLLDGPSA